jgi:hypothetical protein
MRLIGAAVALTLSTVLTGCAGVYGGYGYPGFGVAPDDQIGMVSADSACDFNRDADDMGSTCYVTRRDFDYSAGKYE